jgi:hypothetical protein
MVLQLFLRGFLRRLVGESPARLSFFLRSAFLSVALVFGITILQSFFSKDTQLLSLLANYISIGLIPSSIMICTNVLIDYLSNAITLSCVRMAAASGRWFDLLVTFLADFSLTITLFTLLFPIGLALASAALESAVKPVQAQLTAVPIVGNSPLRLMITLTNDAYRALVLQLAPISASGTILVQNLSVIVPVDRRNQEAISDAVWLLSDGQSTPTLSLPSSAIFPLNFPKDFWNVDSMLVRYVTGFNVVNGLRNAFINMVRFDPLVIKLAALYSDAADLDISQSRGVVKCSNFTIKTVTIGKAELNNLVDQASSACNGAFVAAATFLEGHSIGYETRVATLGQRTIPVAVFFLTSIVLSAFYYLGIAFTYLGLLLNRVAQALFSTPLLSTKDVPFTVLSLLSFVILESVRVSTILVVGGSLT